MAEEEYSVKTEWNMSLQDMKVVDAARIRAEDLLVLSRYDVSVALSFIDAVSIMYRVIHPQITQEKTTDAYKERRVAFEVVLANSLIMADREVKRASRLKETDPFRSVGASKLFLERANELMRLVYKLKDDVGLGMHRREKRDLESAIRRAAK